MDVHFIKSIVFKSCERFHENFHVPAFTTSSGTNKHQTVTNLDGIIQLQHFLIEARNWLEIVFENACVNGIN